MNKLILQQEELPYGVAEELKTLRTNLQFCGDDIHVILFTSCVDGEGKSTVSLELARSLAEIGKKVLLLDTDLRKSVLREKVQQGRIYYGLTHYLVGQCKQEEILYATQTDNLQVVPSGPVPPNPSELLSRPRFTQLLADLRPQYDFILVDCAPLGMVVDSAVVAPQCDGAVLVMEAGTVSYRLAQEVQRKLQNAHCNLLGVVLNKVDRRSDKYYSYGYGKYGKYYDKKYSEYYK